MNATSLIIYFLTFLWQALALLIRLLRWLISQYLASRAKAAKLPPPPPPIPPKPSFQNIPLKLQLEVLQYCHWREVLRLRRTCKAWNRATKTREVWANLVKRFAAFQNRAPSPEEPVDAYTGEELERWLLTRLSVELGWRNEKQEPTRYRPIKCNAPVVFHLIEGGRWLLVPDVDGIGRVSVYDLDKRYPSANELIEPLDKLDAHRTSLMAVEIDRLAKTLTFNVLLTTCVARDPHTAPHIRIYKVQLKGHGSNACLQTRHLTSFSIPGVGQFSSVDLRGDMLARARKSPKCSFVEVYKWTQSTSMVHTRVRIPVEHDIESLKFVESDRIVAFSRTHMFIFPIPAFQTVQSSMPDALDTVPPLWKLPCSGQRLYRGGLSPSYFDLKTRTTSFALCTADGIYGISIPHEHKAKPRLMKLVEYETTTESGYTLGLSKAFFRHRDSSSTTVSYLWLEDEVKRNREFRLRASVAIRERGYPGQWDADPPVMDELSGRIVQFTKTGFIVLDTALCYDGRTR